MSHDIKRGGLLKRRRSSLRGRLLRDFRIESLESRHLLAGDLVSDADPSKLDDPILTDAIDQIAESNSGSIGTAAAPVVTFEDLTTNDSSPPLEGTVDKPLAKLNVIINTFLYEPTNNGDGTWSLEDDSIASLEEGVHEVQITAWIGANSTTINGQITIDVTAPIVGVDIASTNETSPEISGTIDDAAASVSVDVDGSSYTAEVFADGTWSVAEGTVSPPLGNGTYDVVATATDLAGNSSSDATIDELQIDATAPAVTVDQLTTVDPSPMLTGMVDDPLSTVTVTVAGSSYAANVLTDGTWQLPSGTINPPLADGIYDVEATAIDSLGNSGFDQTTDELRIDRTPPMVSVNPTVTNSPSPGLDGTVSEPAASVTVTIAGVSYLATNRGDGTWFLPSGQIDPPLAEGTYDVVVVAEDAASNIGSDATTDELIVDLTAPTVTVDVIQTSNSSPEITGTVDDLNATVGVSLDGNSYTPTVEADGTWRIAAGVIDPALAEGVFNILASAIDEAGNVGLDGTSNELTVDLTAPIVTVDVRSTTDTTPRLTGTVDDPNASIVATVDGQAYSASNLGDGTWELADGAIVDPLATGTYDVQVNAFDAAGNVGSDVTVDELTIDATAPAVSVDALITDDPTPELTGTVDDPDATIAVRVNGQSYAAVNPGDGSWVLADDAISPPLPFGIYDVEVTATNAASLEGTDQTSDELVVVEGNLPQVIATSIEPGDVLRPGSFVLTARFDEGIAASGLDVSDVVLNGSVVGSIVPDAITYDAVARRVRVDFSGVPEDRYELRLLSGDGRFEDIDGNDLDGEVNPTTTVPSGDGTAGGDFVIEFAVDPETVPIAADLVSLRPNGGLIYSPDVFDTLPVSHLSYSGDTDSISIALDEDQTLSAIVSPDSNIQAFVQVLDPNGVSVRTTLATSVGESVFIDSAEILEAGTYTIQVQDLAGAIGGFSIELLLNSTIESELIEGLPNDELALAQSLDFAFSALGGSEMQRAGVFGQLPATADGQPLEDWYQFSLEDGQTTSIAAALFSPGTLSIELYDSAGNQLAFATPAANAEAIISDFVDASDGSDATYFVRVVGADAAYSMLVTRGVGFDSELNDSQASAQPIGPTGSVLGHLGHIVGHTEFSTSFQVGSEADAGDLFGWAVSTDGEWAIVGSPEDSDDGVSSGSAYIYKHNGSDWVEFQKIRASDAGSGDDFGRAVSIVGDVAIVGAPFADSATRKGAAYVYRFDGTDWVEEQKLLSSDAAANDFFGISLDTDGNTIVVGTSYDDDPVSGLLDVGSVYAYTFDGSQWVERQRISPSDPSQSQRFAASVAVDGDTLIVGASQDDAAGNSSGAAYAFEFDGVVWKEQQKLVGGDSTNSDFFGISVAVDDNILLVGATGDDDQGSSSGSAYVFVRSNGLWKENQKIVPSDVDTADTFGTSVAVDGSTLLMGSWRSDSPENDSGAAYIYRRGVGGWVEEEKFVLESPIGGEFYGVSVSIADDKIVIGGANADTTGPDAGLVGFVTSASQSDYYSFWANAGEAVTVSTSLPLGGPNTPVNELNPWLEVYDSQGLLVVTDFDGADGRNASAEFTATASGTYYARIADETNLSGEYVITVAGNSNIDEGVRVVSSTPANDAQLASIPTEIVIQFSETIRFDSIQASDLKVNGSSATSVTMIDGSTAQFTLPALGEGDHIAALAAGSVTDLQNAPLEPFTLSFAVDLTSPTVATSSIAPNETVDAGNLIYTATFDEPIAGIDETTVSLIGDVTGTYEPEFVGYDSETLTATLQFNALPEDDFTLRFISGDGAVEDLAGNDLDGELPFDSLPSGDGIAGGDFVLRFSTDIGTRTIIEPLVARKPLGTLVYELEATGLVNEVGDVDVLSMGIDAGNLLSVKVSGDNQLLPQVVVNAPDGSSLGIATSDSGSPAALNSLPIIETGSYTVSISGTEDSLGSYEVTFVLNADIESEQGFDRVNDSLETAENISERRAIELGDASRSAVVGNLPLRPGVVLYKEDFETGSLGPEWIAASTLEDGRIEISDQQPAASGDFALFMDRSSSGGVGNNNEAILSVDLSGVTDATLSFAHADFGDEEHALPLNFSGSVIGDGVSISDDGTTWFRILDATNITFGQWQNVFFDLDELALSAGMSFGDNFLIKFQQFDDFPLTTDGRAYDSIQITIPQLSEDWYELELEADIPHTFMLASEAEEISLSLFDDTGEELLVGAATANADGFVQLIPSEDATYYARVSGSAADYNLAIAHDSTFGAETNNTFATAQPLGIARTVVGHLSGLPPTSGQIGADPSSGSGNNDNDPPVGADSLKEEDYAPGKLLVRFENEVSTAKSNSWLASKNVSVQRQFKNSQSMLVDVGAETDVVSLAESWSKDPLIAYAEPDYVVQAFDTVPNDILFSSLWGLNNVGQFGGIVDADIDAAEAWDIFTGTDSVVIASIDTGVDYNHEDLADNMWKNTAEENGLPGVDDDGNGFVDDIYGIDTFNIDSDPMDDNDHGTHTAGTFGAVGDNGIGIAGVNWDVQIMALKFLNFAGGGLVSGAVELLDYMVTMKRDFGVNIVASNNSWGSSQYSQSLVEAIQASNDVGILFVAAAGNSGDDIEVQPHYPAAYDHDGIITVAASDVADQLARPGEFGSTFDSNYGETRVDLAAPGVGIFSTVRDNEYTSFNGTSMAAPHVTGAVALLRAIEPNASLAEIKRVILEGVDPIPSMDGLTVTGGRLNLANSISLLGDPGDYYRFNVNDGDLLRIETSTPGDGPLAFKNDLDVALVLHDPSGNVVATADSADNEVLTHAAKTTGNYVVRAISSGGAGEYVVNIFGATGGLPAFKVDAVSPADDAVLDALPTELVLEFNDSLFLSSLSPSDVLVDGQPLSTGLQVNQNIVTFQLPTLSSGEHTIEVAAGAILDRQGTPIDQFESSFFVDIDPPQVVAASIVPNELLNESDVEISFQFNQAIDLGVLDASDIVLMGALSGSVAPTSFEFNPISAALSIEYLGLATDDYVLTLVSAEDGFRDGSGRLLDGDPSFPLPSGDGEAGGDFIIPFRLDATPPVVSVTRLVTSDTTPAVSGLVDDPNATVAVTIDGETYVATNDGAAWRVAGDTITELAEGTYNVIVTATDAAGNVGMDDTSEDLIIDLTPPAIEAIDVETNDSTPELTGSIDDSTAVVMVVVDGVEYTATNLGDSWRLEGELLPEFVDGQYTYEVQGIDPVGNETIVSASLIIDTVAPELTMPNDIFINNGSPLLEGGVTGGTSVNVEIDGSSYEASLDADVWTITAGQFSELVDGEYVVTVTAFDNAGNSTVSSFNLTVDTIAPILSSDDLATRDSSPSLTGTIDDPSAELTIVVNGQVVAHIVDGNAWEVVAGTFGPLPDGEYAIQANAVDLAGNMAVSDATLLIDSVAPIIGMPDVVTNEVAPLLEGSIDDETAVVTVTVDDQSFTASVSGATWVLDAPIDPPLGEGTYTVSIDATDLAGNAGTATASLTIDLTAPSVTIVELTTSDDRPAVMGTIDDPAASIEVTIGGIAYPAENLGTVWRIDQGVIFPLAVGVFATTVVATDEVGNQSTESTSLTHMVGPIATVDDLLTGDITPELMGAISDSAAVVEVVLNGNSYAAQNVDGQWIVADDIVAPLGDGQYILEVKANLPGNDTAMSTLGLLTVDTNAPTVEIEPLLTNDNTPEIRGLVDDDFADVVVEVDGQFVNADVSDGEWVVPNDALLELDDGSYDVSITATDSVSNSSLFVGSLTIDTVAPSIAADDVMSSSSSPALSGTTNDPDAIIQVEIDGQVVNATVDGALWTVNPVQLLPLSDGDYVVIASARDAASNVGLATFNVLIDTVGPELNFDGLVTSDSSPTLFGVVGDDAVAVNVTVGEEVFAASIADGRWTLGEGVIGPLVEGEYPVEVVASDSVGNETTVQGMLVVDQTSPVATYNSIATRNNQPRLAGAVDDATAEIVVEVGGQTVLAENLGSSWQLVEGTLTPIVDGTFPVTVTATDGAGNSSTASGELTVDTVAPVVELEDIATSDTTPTLSGFVDDDAIAVEVRVDGVPYDAVIGAMNWSIEEGVLPELGEGSYPVELTATDAVGNQSVVVASLIVDLTAPTLAVENILTNLLSPELSGTVSDPLAEVRVTVDGNSYLAENLGDGTWLLPSGLISPPLTEGEYSFDASATDLAGNHVTESGKLSIETVPPEVTVDSAATADPSPTILGTVDDPFAEVTVTIDGASYSAVIGDGVWQVVGIGPLADGMYEVAVLAEDVYGNVSTAEGTLLVDLTAPNITVSDIITPISSPQLDGTIDDANAVVQVTVNEGDPILAEVTASGWTIDAGVLAELSDGSYSIEAIATDTFGNVSTATGTLTIDSAAPVVTADNVTTNQSQPSLQGTIDDPTAVVVININDEEFEATNLGGTWTLSLLGTASLSDGAYNYSVKATDLAGNSSTSNAVVIVDTVAPLVTFDDVFTSESQPELSGNVDDATAFVTVTVNGRDYVAAVTGNTWVVASGEVLPLADGEYPVSVTARDFADNEGISTKTLTVDSTPPALVVEDIATFDTTPSLSGGIDDATATVEVSIEGQTFTATNDGVQWTVADDLLSALPDGTYPFSVTATDPLGNSSTRAANLTIDTVAPIVSANDLVTNDQSPLLSGDIDDSQAVVSVTVNGETYPAVNLASFWVVLDNTIIPLAAGEYTVNVLARDVAGNESQASSLLTIDIVGPAVTLDDADILTADASPPIAGTIDDPSAAIEVVVNGATYQANNLGTTWEVADDVIEPLADASYVVEVIATDEIGNQSTVLGQLTVDTTPPNVSLSDLVTNDSTPNLSGPIDDPDADVTVIVDGTVRNAIVEDGMWFVDGSDLPVLDDGTYSVTVLATDPLGNQSADDGDLTIDTVAPSVSTNNVVTNNPSPSLFGSIDDSSAVVFVDVEGQIYQALNLGSSWVLGAEVIAALDDGVYDATVRAVDPASNEGTAPLSITIDREVPTLSLDTTFGASSSPELVGSVDDASAEVRITIDGRTYVAQNNGTEWVLPEGTISPRLLNGSYLVTLSATDLAGNTGTATSEVAIELPSSNILDRHIFYNNSSFDGYDSAANADDDNAIAVDNTQSPAPRKTALLPGQVATAANYTNYYRGINGIMIDIQNLPVAELTPDDFEFRIGNNAQDPSRWEFVSAEATVSLRSGDGVDGSDRVTIVWPDHAIEGTWLRVRVIASEHTGLVEDDIFYWGNVPGDTEDSLVDTVVDQDDYDAVISSQSSFLDQLTTLDPLDFNRDGLIDGTDLAIVRDHISGDNDSLVLLQAPDTIASSQSASNRPRVELASFAEEDVSVDLFFTAAIDEAATPAWDDPLSVDSVFDDSLLSDLVAEKKRQGISSHYRP